MTARIQWLFVAAGILGVIAYGVMTLSSFF